MSNSLLLGVWRFLFKVPGPIWQRQVENNARDVRTGLGFMTKDHHAIRDFVVRELPRIGSPIPPETIAADLKMPLEKVDGILDELEKRMTFLFRNDWGPVAWAYPVTAEPTPHHVTFSSGEQVHAA